MEKELYIKPESITAPYAEPLMNFGGSAEGDEVFGKKHDYQDDFFKEDFYDDDFWDEAILQTQQTKALPDGW